MLPGIADRLQLSFINLNNGNVIQVPQLTRDHPYNVVGARRVNGQYGSTVLFTLRSEGDMILKVYLPRRYGELIDDIDIEDKYGSQNVQIDFYGIVRSGLFFASATVMPGRTPKTIITSNIEL